MNMGTLGFYWTGAKMPDIDPSEFSRIQSEIRHQHKVPKTLMNVDDLEQVLRFVRFLDAEGDRLADGLANLKAEIERIKKLRMDVSLDYADQIRDLYRNGNLPMAGKTYMSKSGHPVKFKKNNKAIKSVKIREGVKVEDLWDVEELQPYVTTEIKKTTKIDLKAFKDKLEDDYGKDGIDVDNEYYVIEENPDLSIGF